MKTCVSSYSFQPMLSSGELTQLQLIGKVKEMGFDGIEFIDLMPENGMSVEEYAKRLRDESEKKNLPIVNYTIGAELLNRPLDEECERLFKQVDIAEILGASGMRHDATGGFNAPQSAYCGFDQALPTLIEGCRRVTEYAAEKGISTMVENHGYFAQDSDRSKSSSRELQTRTSVCSLTWATSPAPMTLRTRRWAESQNTQSTSMPRISTSRAAQSPIPARILPQQSRNYLRGAVIGHGNIPVAQCIGILKRAGYDKYVSIEFEGIEQTVTGIEIGLENLKRFIAEAE